MVVLLITIFYASFGFGDTFIACELCQQMSNGFDDINDTVDQLNWYEFPVEIQKLMPTLLLNVQQPVLVECFGSITCSREVFIKVSKMIYIRNQLQNEFALNII